MKLSVFEVQGWERDAFDRMADDHELRFEPGPLDLNLVADHADADAVSTFIYSDLGADVLDAFDRLGLVATRSTGVDHIDIDWCRAHDVTVSNVPTYGTHTVAEHVFALLLALSHRIVDAAERTRLGDFSQTGLQGFDLRGRTMGVIGTGEIGQHTIRIARGFGMEVVAFDVQPQEGLADELGMRFLAMDELLAIADVVSLHVPGGEKTHHMIGEEQFQAMKPGTVLINTSRGGVVDTQALLAALSDGTVAAAGLDVVEEEPVLREEAELLHAVITRDRDLETLLSAHVLLRLQNVLITPHSAFNTREAVQRILDTTFENIDAFAAGEPRNVVT